MSSIRKLQPDVYTLIRSQVIIESISDVVRELLHNSVDAGASAVSIYLDLESLSICVEDNGAGISPSDMELVGKRYYTSKYSEKEGLIDSHKEDSHEEDSEIMSLIPEVTDRTLGFRGEALSCIADQCSKLMIVSNFRRMVNYTVLNGDNLASLVNMLLSFFGINSPLLGTVVIISRLFHNMPVRMKYTREKCHKSSIAFEIRNIIFRTFAHRSFTRITASFLNKGERQTFVSLHLQGKPERLFCSLFHVSFSFLRNICEKDDEFSLQGFFGVSHGIKSSMNFIFCNGSPIQLTHRKTGTILSLLKYAIRSEVKASKSARMVLSVCFNTKTKMKEKEPSHPNDQFQMSWKIFLRLLKLSLEIPIESLKKKTRRKLKDLPDNSDHNCKNKDIDQITTHTVNPDAIPVVSLDLQRGNFKIISQVDRLFIIATINDKLCVVDQHACDERITVEGLFQSYMEQASNPDCDLRIKCKSETSINLSSEEIPFVRRNQGFMNLLGFDYKVEDNTVIVTHLPKYLHKYNDPVLLKSCLIQFSNKDENEYTHSQENNQNHQGEWLLHIESLPTALKDAIISMACRLSIKFGQILTTEEMDYLLKLLGSCSLPFQCAHGRPTLFPVGNITPFREFMDDYEL